MSAKPSKSPPRAAVFNMEAAAQTLREWEALRTSRDQGAGNLEASEALLSKISGKLTDREAVHGLVNSKEREAAAAVLEWREVLCYEPDTSESKRPRRDPSKELIEFYEQWRAVVAMGDHELTACWIQEQSWAERLVIQHLFSRPALPSS